MGVSKCVYVFSVVQELCGLIERNRLITSQLDQEGCRVRARGMAGKGVYWSVGLLGRGGVAFSMSDRKKSSLV